MLYVRMPPKKFEGRFGIPSSHSVPSLLTRALYRLPESVSQSHVESIATDIETRMNAQYERNGEIKKLPPEEKQILLLKLVRHFEDNGESAPIDIPTMVDALVESPKFLKSDKGSVGKLFEMHEMKTLQKIAELRRKKAEHAGTEELNPYENLFETSSGKFYLARLLNMPHLEEESMYMDHCVGTSTSYINKIKKGDVEIFSFRNKASHEPVVTIEYNRRTRNILQIKSIADTIPKLSDTFSRDLIEAIGMLTNTHDDSGEMREIRGKELAHLKLLLELDDKFERGESFTREDLIFLYEIDEPIIGFDAEQKEPLIQELRNSTIIEEDMLVIFECTKDQIAHVPSEITSTTRAYVGPLQPDIFQKLPETLEHVYTSFPERRIRRESVGIGGKSREQLISEMVALGISISRGTKPMMNNPDLVVGENREELKLVRLTVADLGFQTCVTTDQIYERAQALGLELCPPDTGPNYRLQYKDQPLNEWVYIGMKQITDSVGNPSVFSLGRYGDVLWLSHYGTNGDYQWNPDDEFVFRFRKVGT